LPFWRYLNDERIELGDIDLDLAPSKLPKIFEEIRKERGELGLLQVCTFGTESTKSAILTACRGYRSEDYPDGIDVDEAQYMSSLVPSERGFIWPLNDLINGNEDKGRKPQYMFVKAVNQYPGLLDIMLGIEGLICRRGIHASGVILYDEETVFDYTAVMRAPNGNLTTQWDLHDVEAAGSVKYDFLVTAVQDIIIKTIDLLKNDGIVEQSLTLREIYDKYLHPNKLPQNDPKIWKALADGSVLSVFQFDGGVGQQAAKKIKPTSMLEMADANGLMRLMPESQGAESPLDKYVKYKNNINLWYQEMDKAGLTKEEQAAIEPYFKPSYGVPPSQEQLMRMLMDEKICNFTLAEANAARKIVGKKQMSKIPALKQKVLETAKSKALGEYIWKYGAGPQMGYSFSIIHALAYSFVGLQTLYLATYFNPIYWNTACLIVNSGSLEDVDQEEIVSIYEPENDGAIYKDLPDRSGKVKKTSTTDYTKVAKAIGQIKEAGIQISLADINKSLFSFIPDTENNQILFGLKGMMGVGDDLVQDIIDKRPYASPRDFLNKVKPNRAAMVSLIKGGAFDHMMDRKLCMGWYIWETCDKKKRITLQNMPGLMKYGMIPEDTDERIFARRIYEFNRYLKAITIPANKLKPYFVLDERAVQFLIEIEKESLICRNGNIYCILKTDWDKIYQKHMDVFRAWIAENHDDILYNLNKIIFLEDWNKYAKGNYSSWEMEALCFYYHPHELINLNNYKYGFSNFFELPEEPEIERSFWKGNKEIHLYKLTKIAGTCIAKNKIKSTISLLTVNGVVEVKFVKEVFAMFDKQISARGADGVKHVIEKSWFNRGNMLIIQGMRRDDMFVAKKYQSSGGHLIYHIDEVLNDEIKVRTTRAQGDLEEEE
jgi:DNA polymerase-3 subunit alpha